MAIESGKKTDTIKAEKEAFEKPSGKREFSFMGGFWEQTYPALASLAKEPREKDAFPADLLSRERIGEVFHLPLLKAASANMKELALTETDGEEADWTYQLFQDTYDGVEEFSVRVDKKEGKGRIPFAEIVYEQEPSGQEVVKIQRLDPGLHEEVSLHLFPPDSPEVPGYKLVAMKRERLDMSEIVVRTAETPSGEVDRAKVSLSGPNLDASVIFRPTYGHKT